MIYSAAADNFLRVELMVGIAEALYHERKNIEARRDPDAKGNLGNLEMDTYHVRQKEQAMAEAILTFTVITLESLVNQALAEKIVDATLACRAIEYPRQFSKETHVGVKGISELFVKLSILSDQNRVPNEIAEHVMSLVTIRHQVVHDKPFYLSTDDEGEVIYLPYKIREKDTDKVHLEISALPEHFMQADQIIEYITSIVDVCAGFRFGSLVQRLGA